MGMAVRVFLGFLKWSVLSTVGLPVLVAWSVWRAVAWFFRSLDVDLRSPLVLTGLAVGIFAIAANVVSALVLLYLVFEWSYLGVFAPKQDDMGEALALVFGSSAAIIGFLLNHAFQVRAASLDEADGLFKDFEDEGLREGFRDLGAIIKKHGVPSQAKEFVAWVNDEGVDYDKLHNACATVGNFAERMAIKSARRMTVEDIVFQFYGGMLVRVLPLVLMDATVRRRYALETHDRGLVATEREVFRPELFENAERLYRRWEKRQRRSLKRFNDRMKSGRIPTLAEAGHK